MVSEDSQKPLRDDVRRPKPEVYPKPISRGLTVLNALAPSLTDWFVRTYGRRRVKV